MNNTLKIANEAEAASARAVAEVERISKTVESHVKNMNEAVKKDDQVMFERYARLHREAENRLVIAKAVAQFGR